MTVASKLVSIVWIDLPANVMTSGGTDTFIVLA